jgi:hypothetical protein
MPGGAGQGCDPASRKSLNGIARHGRLAAMPALLAGGMTKIVNGADPGGMAERQCAGARHPDGARRSGAGQAAS